MSLTFLAPNNGQATFQTRYSSYAPNAGRVITVPSPTLWDIADLLNMGCVAIPQFGSGGATFGYEGNINTQIASAGVNPGATAADSVLAVYSLPANSFDQISRGLQITAAGSFAANSNNKRVKLIFNATTAVVGSAVTGGTTIADTSTVTTSGGGWQLSAQVFKYGPPASNTQIGIHSQAQVGGAVAALVAPQLITAAENGSILIAVTGNATTVVSDIALNWLEINAMN